MNSRLVPVNGSSPAAAGGHHRQKLDLIRSSLRPFEQQQKWREEENEEHIPEEEADEEEDEDRKAGMMRALVEAGYDQESAFYALKLVNFRSAQDAELVLRSIKKNLMKQHQVNSAGGGIPLLDSSPQHQPHSINGVAPWPAERLAPAKSLPISGPQQQNNKLPSAKPNPVKAASRLSPPSQGYLFKQSQSFGPVDFPQSSRPPPMSTVIRIERNQSERLERKAAIDPPPRQPPQTAQLPRKVQQRELRSPAASRLHPTISLPACAPSASCSTSPTAALAMASPRPVQRIFIDPEEEGDGEALLDLQPPPNYGQYMDQMNRKMDGRLPAFSPSAFFSSSPSPGPANPVASANRSVSPLPESVAKRLKAGSYERVVKPCRAPMFRFFMEQHIEKLSQQNQERNKRARQLSHEMEAAGLADNVKENMLRLLRQKESKYLRMRRQKMNRTMFELIRHIGIGAFGKVTLVRKRDTDQVYAMKTLVKADVIQKQQAAHVKAERDILSEANSAWIVKLFFSFQDAQNLYFIMEYVPGGDMMQLLINMGIFPESLARFYTAELCLAVEYVHSLGFIHRDIKPDNILIDRGGHIKLTDFGLCTGLRWTHDKRHYVVYDAEQQNGIAHLREDSFSLPAGLERRVKLLEMRHHRRDRAHSVVGTGNYMAPEVIQRVGHTQLCDWWSVGVILYEMVYGRPPFMSQRDDPAETQYMIVHWRRFLDLNNPMGARLSRNCVNCISRLCCDQEMRLGHRQGAKDIKEHAWFRGIDFANLRNSTPEYVPRVRHPEDTSNFDTFEVRSDELAANGTGAGSSNRAMGGGGPAGGAPNFFDFTFRHFFSEGIGPPTSRGQQPRPSLAPLMETAEPSGSKSVANASTTTTNVPAAPGSKVPPSPIRPKLPSKAALYSPPSARTVLQIGQFRPLQTKLDEEEAEESQC